jgi:hypothetical protein
MGSKKRKWEKDHSYADSKLAFQATIGATNFCEPCRSMTSTKVGLSAIAEGSYVRRGITELMYSARYGCSLCRKIHNGLQQTTLPTNESIMISGSFEELSSRAGLSPGNNAHAQHPFVGKTLSGIEVFSKTEHLMFNASTPSSKCP